MKRTIAREPGFLLDDGDQAALRTALGTFLRGEMAAQDFDGAAMKLVGQYDGITRSLVYGEIEEATGRHCCAFWRECADACSHSESAR